MRSRKTELEQQVIIAARDYVDALAAKETTQAHIDTLVDLIVLVGALRRYTDDNFAARGAHNEVDTSVAAAYMAQPTAGTTRRRILDEIRFTHAINALNTDRPYGLTDEELESCLNGKHTTISSARNWLVNAGWLEASTWRRDTTSGRKAIVWVLTGEAERIITSPEWVLQIEGNH